jgi:hypothetical protein
MLVVLFSLIFPLLAGWMVVSTLFRTETRSGLITVWALAFGVGVGLFSCLIFVLLLIFGPSQKALIAVEVILGGSILVHKSKQWRRSGKATGAAAPAARAEPGIMRILAACFYFVLAVSLTTSLVLIIKSPHGQWDAWAIWNLKARYIFRGGSDWRLAFSSVLQNSHPDYPLLLPLSVAGSWILTGRETLAAPAALSFLFTFAVLVLLASSLGTLRGKSQGYAAGLLLLGTSLFIPEGSSQLADAPIAFFYLAAAVLLALYHASTPSDGRLLVLAGLAAGFAAWTKNEGMLFLAAMIIALLVTGFPQMSLTVRVRKTLLFLAGAVPAALVLGVFKTLVAGGNDILSPESKFQKLLSLTRYIRTAQGFASEVWGFGGWGISAVVILAAYLALLGVDVDSKNRLTIRTLLGVLCIMFAGLFFTFVLTPYDLGWHLQSALHRLLLQMWPTFLLTFFLVARTPEKALAPKSQAAQQPSSEGVSC